MNIVKAMEVLDGRIGAIPQVFSVILALKRKQAFNIMIYNFNSQVDKTLAGPYMSEGTTQSFGKFG